MPTLLRLRWDAGYPPATVKDRNHTLVRHVVCVSVSARHTRCLRCVASAYKSAHFSEDSAVMLIAVNHRQSRLNRRNILRNWDGTQTGRIIRQGDLKYHLCIWLACGCGLKGVSAPITCDMADDAMLCHTSAGCSLLTIWDFQAYFTVSSSIVHMALCTNNQ